MDKLSTLQQLIAIELDARRFGFEWPHANMILEQAVSECQEINHALEKSDRDHLQEEIGDLLHCAISLCLFTGFDVEQTLVRTTAKFTSRIQALKALTRERGLENLQGQTVEFMFELWRELKTREKT